MKKILTIIGLSLAFVSPLYACYLSFGYCKCHIPDIPSQRFVQNQGHANTYGLNPTINEAQNQPITGNHMLAQQERHSQERMLAEKKLEEAYKKQAEEDTRWKIHQADLEHENKRFNFLFEKGEKQIFNLEKKVEICDEQGNCFNPAQFKKPEALNPVEKLKLDQCQNNMENCFNTKQDLRTFRKDFNNKFYFDGSGVDEK